MKSLVPVRFLQKVQQRMSLLGWAILCFVLACLSGVLGFTGIAAGFMVVARVLFALFLLGFLILIILVILGIGVVAAV